jgi:hypothetical protein
VARTLPAAATCHRSCTPRQGPDTHMPREYAGNAPWSAHVAAHCCEFNDNRGGFWRPGLSGEACPLQTPRGLVPRAVSAWDGVEARHAVLGTRAGTQRLVLQAWPRRQMPTGSRRAAGALRIPVAERAGFHTQFWDGLSVETARRRAPAVHASRRRRANGRRERHRRRVPSSNTVRAAAEPDHDGSQNLRVTL